MFKIKPYPTDLRAVKTHCLSETDYNRFRVTDPRTELSTPLWMQIMVSVSKAWSLYRFSMVTAPATKTDQLLSLWAQVLMRKSVRVVSEKASEQERARGNVCGFVCVGGKPWNTERRWLSVNRRIISLLFKVVDKGFVVKHSHLLSTLIHPSGYTLRLKD